MDTHIIDTACEHERRAMHPKQDLAPRPRAADKETAHTSPGTKSPKPQTPNPKS